MDALILQPICGGPASQLCELCELCGGACNGRMSKMKGWHVRMLFLNTYIHRVHTYIHTYIHT